MIMDCMSIVVSIFIYKISEYGHWITKSWLFIEPDMNPTEKQTLSSIWHVFLYKRVMQINMDSEYLHNTR